MIQKNLLISDLQDRVKKCYTLQEYELCLTIIVMTAEKISRSALPRMSTVGQQGIPRFCHIVPSASFTTGCVMS